MKRIACIFLTGCFLFSAPLIGLAVKYAWWLRITYEPETTHIQSIPVSDIDPSWSLAETLSKDAIPSDEMSDFEKHFEPYGYSFSKEGDFNADGKRDRALVGIYKDRSGEEGRFLLILTENQPNNWVKSFVHKIPGRAGFSILRMRKDQLAWYFCIDCDIFSFIKWEKMGMLLSRSKSSNSKYPG